MKKRRIEETSSSGRTDAEWMELAGLGQEAANCATPPFKRSDLTVAIRDGVEPPEELIEGVLLRGKVHSIYAKGGLGKSVTAAYLTLQAVRKGLTVVYFDEENGLRVMAERLQDLGMTLEEAKRVHYYPFSDFSLEEGVVNAHEKLLDEVKPDLVIYDSWINLLAACGLSENDSVDIATWAQAYAQKARQREIAVLILDHVPKDGDSARGSGRKLDYVDVMWELRRPQEFNRETVGRIDLYLRKDREGWLPKTLTFSVGGSGGGDLLFVRSEGTVETVDEDGLLPSERTALEALQALGRAVRAKEWREYAVTADFSESTFWRAKRGLESKGRVSAANGRFSIATVTTVNNCHDSEMTVSNNATVSTVTPYKGDSVTASADTSSDRAGEEVVFSTSDEADPAPPAQADGIHPRDCLCEECLPV